MANLQKESQLTFIIKTSIKKAIYRCYCNAVKEINITRVEKGEIISCGCNRKKPFNKGTHRLSAHSLYGTWASIKSRCYNPKDIGYKSYGAVGIYVCDLWRNSPESFINWAISNGWKKGMQIDKDIKGGKVYSPDNCMIVTRKVNCNNRNTNKMILYNGVSKSITDWADELGLNNQLLGERIRRGWDIEKAFNSKVNFKLNAKKCK